MSDKEVKTVNCPNCKDEVQWVDSNKHRPFCSERCKLIDFGEWATEKHAIAGDPVFPPEDNSDENLQ